MNPLSDLTTLDYVNWGYGEPNNHNGEENCAVWCLLSDIDESYWNDYFCYATKSYICQIPRGKDPAGKKTHLFQIMNKNFKMVRVPLHRLLQL